MRHELVNLATDTCDDVEMKPHLQPLQDQTFTLNSTTTDDASLDSKAGGLRESRCN